MPAWTVSKSKSHHAQLITVQLIAEAQTCTRTRVRMTKQGKPSVKLGSSKNEHAQTSQKKKHTKPFLAHSAGQDKLGSWAPPRKPIQDTKRG